MFKPELGLCVFSCGDHDEDDAARSGGADQEEQGPQTGLGSNARTSASNAQMSAGSCPETARTECIPELFPGAEQPRY